MRVRTVIGVMGSGRPLDEAALSVAKELGAMIARRGWVVLSGGRAEGVMDAASRGAREAGGLVVGVLPDDDLAGASEHLDVAIRTGMGDGRNVINVLSSDVVIALPGGAGTLSEVALALNADKTVIAVGWDPGPAMHDAADGRLVLAGSPIEALARAAIELEGR